MKKVLSASPVLLLFALIPYAAAQSGHVPMNKFSPSVAAMYPVTGGAHHVNDRDPFCRAVCPEVINVHGCGEVAMVIEPLAPGNYLSSYSQSREVILTR
jgi:hypothetical protein